jgi:hypothetical protein
MTNFPAASEIADSRLLARACAHARVSALPLLRFAGLEMPPVAAQLDRRRR